jgi:hypothetical protein
MESRLRTIAPDKVKNVRLSIGEGDQELEKRLDQKELT